MIGDHGGVSDPLATPEPSDVPELLTARLRLRGWREADRAPFAALNADPAVTAFLSSALTRAESDAFVDRIVGHWREDGFGPWALDRLEDGAFIGFTGLAIPAFAPDHPLRSHVTYRLSHERWATLPEMR